MPLELLPQRSRRFCSGFTGSPASNASRAARRSRPSGGLAVCRDGWRRADPVRAADGRRRTGRAQGCRAALKAGRTDLVLTSRWKRNRSDGAGPPTGTRTVLGKAELGCCWRSPGRQALAVSRPVIRLELRLPRGSDGHGPPPRRETAPSTGSAGKAASRWLGSPQVLTAVGNRKDGQRRTKGESNRGRVSGPRQLRTDDLGELWASHGERLVPQDQRPLAFRSSLVFSDFALAWRPSPHRPCCWPVARVAQSASWRIFPLAAAQPHDGPGVASSPMVWPPPLARNRHHHPGAWCRPRWLPDATRPVKRNGLGTVQPPG